MSLVLSSWMMLQRKYLSMRKVFQVSHIQSRPVFPPPGLTLEVDPVVSRQNLHSITSIIFPTCLVFAASSGHKLVI